MRVLNKIVKTFLVIWLILIFYFLGYFIGHKNIIFEENYKPKLVNTELKKPQEVNFELFWRAWELVTEKYVGEYSVQELVYGAIKGMVEALDDPYSTFMEESDSQILLDDLSGEIEGVGIEISQKDNRLIIIAPLEDSPAQKAGLKPKDVILEVDGQDTSNMTLDEAVSRIRGKSGTEVILLIGREGFESPQEFKVTRTRITISSVSWEMKGDVGYIKITQFGQDTTSLAEQAARELKENNPKAIILDLRNNPGGYLDSSVDIASLFLPRDTVVVQEEYKDGHRDELKTTIEPILKDYKIIVLINEGSASASEIVAGALQDWEKAILVGKSSFGKGSVQELDNLDLKTTLRLTIAKWLTPKGRTIDKEGIKPDYEVDQSDEQRESGIDPQLEKALELAQ